MLPAIQVARLSSKWNRNRQPGMLPKNATINSWNSERKNGNDPLPYHSIHYIYRYIEVFQCCAEDMSLLLNVLPTPAAGSTASAQQIMPSAGGLLATPNGGPLPPLIPLAAGPFPPQNGAPGPAVPPLLAFPTTTGQFLPPTTLGISNDSNGAGMATAAILMPQFAAPVSFLAY